MARIELATTVWKTVVLPLNYIRKFPNKIFVELVKTATPREGFYMLPSTKRESNSQPADYKSAALPIEPLVHIKEVTYVKAITTLLNCILLDSASSLCRLSHLKGQWGAPYAVQLTLSAFSLGSSITPNWHFTKVAKSLYKISHLLVYDFDCFHWRINTHNLFSSSTTPRSWQ